MDHGAIVDDGDVLARDLVAEHVGVEDVADAGTRDLRPEDDRSLLGADSARSQTAQRPARSLLADRLRGLELLRRARDGVPVVTLHPALLVDGDGGDGEVAVAAAVLAGEAAGVH